jgi:hypothetical protein
VLWGTNEIEKTRNSPLGFVSSWVCNPNSTTDIHALSDIHTTANVHSLSYTHSVTVFQRG